MQAILHKRLRGVVWTMLAGLVIGPALGALLGLLDNASTTRYAVQALWIGLLAGAAIGGYEQFIGPRVSRRHSFRVYLVLRVAVYTFILMSALVGVDATARVGEIARAGTSDHVLRSAVRQYILEATFGRDLALSMVLAVIGSSLINIAALFNPRQLLRYLSGQYFYPEDVDRLFLFVDIRGSTELAERLGAKRYSRMVSDLFTDLAEPILAWKGEVYQYVGDGVIVTWPLSRGIPQARCVRCFFEMQGIVARRSPVYRRLYGAVPSIKASLHGGPVVAVWVGEVKKELAYHGDVLNTTARIESLCNETGEDLLVSEVVFRLLPQPHSFESRPVGRVALRGKAVPLVLFGVRRRTAGAPSKWWRPPSPRWRAQPAEPRAADTCERD